LGESLLDTAKIEGEQIGVQKGEKIGIEKGEKIGIEKGEKIGIEKGEKIGIEKGRAEGFYITLLVAIRNGMSVEDVAKFFNVSIETVEKLKKLLNKYGDEAEQHLNQI